MGQKSSFIITGCAGFIGSLLALRLLDEGHAVLGLDNFLRGTEELLKPLRGKEGFSFIEGDLSEPGQWEKQAELWAKQRPITALWHMAANSDIQAGVNDPNVDLKHTFMTTYRSLSLMKALNIPEILFASSSAIYGERDEPLKENAGPLTPASNYGAMKLASEAIISSALSQNIKRAVVFRFPNVVGPNLTHGVIFDFLHKLKQNPSCLEVLGNGTQKKPYLHVNDLIDAMLLTYKTRTKNPLEVYNISADSSSTVRFIAEEVVSLVSPGAKIQYGTSDRGWVGDVPHFSYDCSKIKSLGWKPKLTSSDAVIRQAILEALNTSAGGKCQK